LFPEAVKLINTMRTILANLKERINSKLKSKKMLQRKITTPRAGLILINLPSKEKPFESYSLFLKRDPVD